MPKKNESALEKAYTAHINAVEKSIKVLQNTMNRVNDAMRNGVKVDLSFDPEATMAKLESYRKRKVDEVSLKSLRSQQSYLREAMRSTYYDKLVHYHLDYQKKEGDMAFNVPVTISQYDINTIRNREVAGKGISKKDLSIVLKWAEATKVANNYNAPILETPDDVKNFLVTSRKKRLDLSIGGMSSLINDLGYSSGTSLGKEFVEWLRILMQGNKEIFATLEKWYNTDKEGKELKYVINNAVGKSWYKNYREFASAIVEFIDKMDSRFNIEVPDKLRWDAEKEASEALT